MSDTGYNRDREIHKVALAIRDLTAVIREAVKARPRVLIVNGAGDPDQIKQIVEELLA